MRFYFICVLAGLISISGNSQVVYENIDNPVYQLLDEIAAKDVIDINTFSKPYSRKFIAESLELASAADSLFNRRQNREIAFYLKDYGKELNKGKDWDRRRDLFYYSDSVFKVTVNPIVGGRLFRNENGSKYHRYVGGEIQGYINDLGFSAALRDNGVSEVTSLPQHLTTEYGYNFKTISTDNRSDFSEMTGSISYGWNWGSVSLNKQRLSWGNSYRSPVVFSGKAPSYVYFDLSLKPVKWLDFKYIHGWLASEVMDSSRTYLSGGVERRVNTNKNIAANYFTIKTKAKIDITLGNSVIYSDAGVQPVYFIPFMFFKSLDHTYSGTGSNSLGQNSQMFADVSIRTIRNFHFYTSLFLDELSVSNMWDSENHTNLYSWAVGLKGFNILPNVHLNLEYTRTNPWTYRHQVESTTYASNKYNLGNYLGENSEEYSGSLEFKPLRGLRLKGTAWYARKGTPHQYEVIHGNANVTGLKFIQKEIWRQYGMEFTAHYEIINNLFVFAHAMYSDIEGEPVFTPDYYSGKTITLSGGFNFGF